MKGESRIPVLPTNRKQGARLSRGQRAAMAKETATDTAIQKSALRRSSHVDSILFGTWNHVSPEPVVSSGAKTNRAILSRSVFGLAGNRFSGAAKGWGRLGTLLGRAGTTGRCHGWFVDATVI